MAYSSAGFSNGILYCNNVNFTNVNKQQGQITADGQLLIGNAVFPFIRTGTLTSPNGTITIGYSAPNITIDLAGGTTAIDSIAVDASTPPGTNPVLPDVAGQVTFTGAQVAAGVVGTNVMRVNSLAVNSATWEIQRSQAVASTTLADNGVCHFDSARFTVDANGFVSLNGSGVGQTITGNSGPALSPTAGNWNIFGASVAAGTTPVASSGSGSTLTLNVQTSQAIASTNATNIGLSAFNSAHFIVDANGFVSSKGAGFVWIDQGTSITLAVNTGYFVTAATTQTLPASPSQGDVVKIICDTASSVVVTANTGQTIRLSSSASSTAGTFTNTARGDALELIYRAATTQWIALNAVGNWTVA